jgi:hypothetical protein
MIKVNINAPNQNFICISVLPRHATCPTHLILLNLNTKIIFMEESIITVMECLVKVLLKMAFYYTQTETKQSQVQLTTL